LLQTTCLTNLLVEVGYYGNVHSSRAGLDPVFADLVSVSRVHWLDLVAEIVDEAHHGLEVPSFASQTLPNLAVIFERSERDESVVRRATTEHFGARVSDVRVAWRTLDLEPSELLRGKLAIGLLGGSIIIV
jgi:hypothetical protein